MPICIDCHAHFLPDEFVACSAIAGWPIRARTRGAGRSTQPSAAIAAPKRGCRTSRCCTTSTQRVALARTAGDRPADLLSAAVLLRVRRRDPERRPGSAAPATTHWPRSWRARRTGSRRSRRSRCSRPPRPSRSCAAPWSSSASGASRSGRAWRARRSTTRRSTSSGRRAASSTCRCSCTRTTSWAASAPCRIISATCSATRRRPA